MGSSFLDHNLAGEKKSYFDKAFYCAEKEKGYPIKWKNNIKKTVFLLLKICSIFMSPCKSYIITPTDIMSMDIKHIAGSYRCSILR